ncbi:uncharacterized protein M6B38_144970 [Iris pallida]|uniref:GST C-terminal domain-containing protein n=1 Tax=Iris pallida TaxID=29817 RepID=A0AAX6FAT7_IRIPA|nr:uncharacterized protein M6B38_144970 [Iris pallida]
MWTASPFFPTVPLTLTSTPKHHRPTTTTTTTMMSLNAPPPPPPIPGGGGEGGGPLTALTRLLWGRSLPPTPLISAVRSTWSATWHLMMRQLAPSSSGGSYSRPASPYPSAVSEAHLSSPEGLVLYAAHPCPWAHRTLLVRALKGLDLPPVSLVVPDPDTGSWVFPGGRDWATGKRSLREVYGAASGRATVPMLWDRVRGEVACNESYGIIEFFNRLGAPEGEGGAAPPELAPEGSEGEIGRWNGLIYPNVNNGVYRCGFAQSQEAYDVAVNDLFTALDMLESHLSTSRYLCGDVLTLADVCLFTTLIRFDLVYNVLFKCTKKKLLEYPSLHGYTRDIYQIPKVAETCNFEAIMDGYYRTLFPLNPSNIRPVMPSDCEHEHLSQPHNRESLSSIGKHPQLLAT